MAPRKSKAKLLPFAHKLVLNQWILSLLGVDPLREHEDRGQQVRPFHLLAKPLRDCNEGLGEDGLHYFYHQLCNWQKPDPGQPQQLSDAALLRYEERIAELTRQLNERREQPVEWKYYQWLALLFVEIYLDQYFHDRGDLLDNINNFVERFNEHWQEQGWRTGITRYGIDELNKICLQCATGSGKTLLMHANFLQFSRYASHAEAADRPARTLLITPNERLSAQHEKEMQANGISVERLTLDNNALFAGAGAASIGGMESITFTEITKLGDRDGEKTIATRNLGDENLLLVDEGHHGLKATEEKGWYNRRERLTERGFAFEYSATFKEALDAAKAPEIEEAYAKAVLFDYSYRWFYEDGYGKDYRIFNIPQSQADHEFSYLTACLLSFYQQMRLYQDKRAALQPYNIEKPLWVFVGSTVQKPNSKNKVEKATASDIVKVLRFIARFLAQPDYAERTIDSILFGDGDTTGLVDDKGYDIFHGSFLYLRELYKSHTDVTTMHVDLLRSVFNSSGGALRLQRLKGDSGEILLKAGNAEKHFGLIYVGEALELTRHVAEDCAPDSDTPIQVEESDFAQGQFASVTSSASPVNLLVGARKFTEGWDCWRVSTLGLMNVGKSEGSQIIQLFGRGVRLKGYDWVLKRSSALLTSSSAPKHIRYLETLNVFGVEASYMEKFKQHLEDEGLPSNDQKLVYSIPMNLTYDFGHQLKVLCPRRKNDNGQEYNFSRDGKMPLLGTVPEQLHKNQVVVDWYSRIGSITSKGASQSAVAGRNEVRFSAEQLSLLDTDYLYFELERYKAQKRYYSLIIRRDKIIDLLHDHSWYTLYAPKQTMELGSYHKVHQWHEIALTLLRSYCDKYYKHCADAFMRPRLEPRALEKGDANLPEAMNGEYQLTVDASEEQLVADVLALKEELESVAATPSEGTVSKGALKANLLANHLYNPLLFVKAGSAIKTAPVALNDSEMQFVEDLSEWLKANRELLETQEIDLYLLRNQSRGKGIGFFEAGNFYPDFIMWLVTPEQQTVIFVEPHGMRHEGPEHPKVQFHTTVKDVEQRLRDRQLRLESFIVTPTKFSDLRHQGLRRTEWEDRHVLFMGDANSSGTSYLNTMFDSVIENL